MNDNEATIEVDVSGVYGNPRTDASIPAEVIKQARELAELIGGDIVQHYEAAMIEFGVRKIVFQSVPMDDEYLARLRMFGDTDVRYDYIVGFEGHHPPGVDVAKAKVELNNLTIHGLMRPFVKDGKPSYEAGMPNRLSDMVGGCSSSYAPDHQYPRIYVRMGAYRLG